jgi:uncharacterized protein (DUF1501 family)
MKQQYASSRREFLKLAAGFASLGLLGMGGASRNAKADMNVTDYKALVCVYLFGGHDGNNMIVPTDATRYAAYKNIRGNLALQGNELQSPILDGAGNPYALHYGMEGMNALYNTGHLAFVLNTGMLNKPLTRAEFLNGNGIPSNLFSHTDQTMQAQAGIPVVTGTGWGARLLDHLGGGDDSLEAVSVSSPVLFLQGSRVRGNVLVPGSNLSLSGLNLWPDTAAAARRDAVNQILGLNSGNELQDTANAIFADGLALADKLQDSGELPPVTTVFPGSSIGNQLKEVLRLIRLRSQQGAGRQVFFCSMDGFDHHSSQGWDHWFRLTELSQALVAFHSALQEFTLSSQVTTFTQSEFGRTFQPNGSGTDHAWGNHHLVLGDAVKGGIYGQMPSFVLGGDNDASSRGVWIPTLSTAQFGATLGHWFGVPDDQLPTIFPSLEAFPQHNIGFMV